METGIAAATLGLIIACVLGGPIAKYLIEKYGLPASSADPAPVELAPEDDKAPIDKMGVMQAMLVVNIAVILGYLVHHWISNATTIKVPLFVPCLIMGIVLLKVTVRNSFHVGLGQREQHRSILFQAIRCQSFSPCR